MCLQEPSLLSLDQETSLKIIAFFLFFFSLKKIRDGLRDTVKDALTIQTHVSDSMQCIVENK